MICPGCGTDVDEKAVYCQKCGERVDMSSTADPLASELQEEPAAVPSPSADAPRTPAEQLREAVQSRDADDDVEEELWEGRFCGKAMIGSWLLCGLVTVVLLAVGLWAGNGIVWGILAVVLLLVWGYPGVLLAYRRLSIRYRLTSQRFFHESGILRHVTDRIEVIDMDDITFDQTILQRMFGVGTIHITSSDRTHPVLCVEGIRDVKNVAGMMDDARRVERLRRGVHIEAV